MSDHTDLYLVCGNKCLVKYSPENALTGTSAPTTSTEGVIGQLYVNLTDGGIYVCTAVSGSVYTWKQKTWVTPAQLAQKQDASTAITTSNISSQIVNKAGYATDAIAINIPGLRNQYFATEDTTPTVNGQICWTYG